MIFHIVISPDEGADLFGGLVEFVFSLFRVYEFVYIGQTIIVLKTIFIPLEPLDHHSGFLVVDLVFPLQTCYLCIFPWT